MLFVKFFKFLLVCSVVFNILLIVRKIARIEHAKKMIELNCFKKISYAEGIGSFKRKIAHQNSQMPNFYFIYMWDSLLYDFGPQEQMRRIDSIALVAKNNPIEYVFATEMTENASIKFQQKNYDVFKNVKQVFEMDDFISGVYNQYKYKVPRPILTNSFQNKQTDNDSSIFQMKAKPLYIIINASGEIIYSCGNRYDILKDTVLLGKLDSLKSLHPRLLN